MQLRVSPVNIHAHEKYVIHPHRRHRRDIAGGRRTRSQGFAAAGIVRHRRRTVVAVRRRRSRTRRKRRGERPAAADTERTVQHRRLSCHGTRRRATARAEGWIDALDEQTPKIRAFVLPGGHPAAALAHVARTVCRRAERNILALSRKEYVDPAVIRFVNRLSDYLFAAARYINFTNGVAEIGWQQKPKQ